MIGPRSAREDDEYARVVYPGTSVYRQLPTSYDNGLAAGGHRPLDRRQRLIAA